jgi:UTP--glucose-1-phosphate uridylyltransferase
VPKHVNCIYIRQAEPLGLGHAVLCARPVIQNEPFAVILADDLIDGKPAVMKQMVDVFAQHQCSILGVQDVPRAETKQYGIVSYVNLEPNVEQVNKIVEKPNPEAAPSTLAVVGRYILTPAIFSHLEKIWPGAGGEIQLTDGIASLLQEERLLAYRFNCQRYDCGSKLGYLKAQVAFALKHEELGADFASYLKTVV